MKAKIIAITIIVCGNAFAYYQAQQGRWLNRDPSNENGGINLYQGLLNNPIGNIDTDGQIVVDSHKAAVELYRSGQRGTHQLGSKTIKDITNEREYTKFLENAAINSAKPSAICANSGNSTISATSPTFQTWNRITGRVNLNASGQCTWSCEGIEMKKHNKCGCSCTVSCSSITISFREKYDFTPHQNDGWAKRQRDRFYGWVASDYGRDQTTSSYWLEATWTDKTEGKFEKILSN